LEPKPTLHIKLIAKTHLQEKVIYYEGHAIKMAEINFNIESQEI
jgi:hypothetical protein